MSLRMITLQFHLKKQNKRSNLLTLTVSYEKISCLIRSKKRNQNKTKKQKNTLIKMIMEAINVIS